MGAAASRPRSNVICEIGEPRSPVTRRIQCYVRLVVAGKLGHLPDGVPVARRAPQPERAFDHGGGQFRVSDVDRVAGVEAADPGGDLLRTLDLAAQRLD